ncbi:MAG: NADH-quinone oxidoreductase subunit NuoG [Cyclobacteriaceae bacterium]
MATLYIDDKPYEVKPGKNVLETCLALGFNLPYFCWHPSLGSIGACRQCAIKVFKNEEDKTGRIIMSCMEPVLDKQRISISDSEATAFRANVIESLMTNHPHDCAVCDEGGSCHLQDMTVMTGHAYRRYQYKKRTYQNQNLGPFINHEMNRCIQCYRCVRFYRDYAGGHDLEAFASKNHVYFGRHEDGTLENEFSGNLAEVCPTGVFTDKTLKTHYTRKWDLTMAPSVCHHCSLGCNIIAGERYGGLRAITSRYHGDVNGYFLCDRGRFGYEFTNAPDRVRQPLMGQQPADAEKIVQEVSQIITSSKVIGIGSPRASLESNFALKAFVGADNFYHGVSDDEHELALLVIKILKEGPARTPSMREVEKADAVFILGEDLTNTAPMMALAVRQSVRQEPIEQITQASIPAWHDAAAREFIQEKRGPLFIATVNTTKLDEIATETYRAAPDDLARLGYAIANLLDNSIPPVKNLSNDLQQLAQRMATALKRARRPVIISGMSSDCATVIKAAANVAWALHKNNTQAGIVLTLPECNSMGLAMMGGHRLHSAVNAVINGHADTVIIIENDLFRHNKNDQVEKFLERAKHVIVLDHTPHRTSQKASVLIPAGTFAESDGTLVNNEGRAQRFFQVHECPSPVQESWRWLLQIAREIKHEQMKDWKNFQDVSHAVSLAEPLLKGIDEIAPPPDFRIAGQKIPREPHRYSGRTAMLANIHVSEEKPPEDPDSPLSYTMEGFRGQAPSSMIPFFWSPGWNSVQSINKYQEEIGGSLRGGNPGLRLLEPNIHGVTKYFTDLPEIFIPMKDHIWMVSLHHIFGSEELSARGAAIAKRVPKSYVMINVQDAADLNITSGTVLEFEITRQVYRLPVEISTSIPKGVGGMPYGLPDLPFIDLPAWAILKNTSHG